MENIYTPVMDRFYLSTIACIDKDGGIGKNGTIPWKCKADMDWFVRKTRSGSGDEPPTTIVIMGNRTFESMKCAALPGRINIIVGSRQLPPQDKNPISQDKTHIRTKIMHVVDFNSAVAESKKLFAGDSRIKTFVIGGSSLYSAALNSPYLYKIYLSEIADMSFDCSVFMFGSKENTRDCIGHIKKTYMSNERHSIYTDISASEADSTHAITNLIMSVFVRRSNVEENKYLALMSKIVDMSAHARPNPNRTVVPTFSLFSKKLKFSLCVESPPFEWMGTTSATSSNKILPLITTKKMAWSAICNELIWFLRGEPNISFLRAKGVKIWDGNTTAEFLARRGLDYAEGETGPIYGVQWRNWNGIDQIAELIAGIIRDPYSRRHIVSAWNVSDIPKMCLPPCHLMSIWKVEPEEGSNIPKYLSCSVLMRSADLFLGVPFNIASYAVLAHLIADICGLTARKLAVDMVDCHIYENHISQCKEQMSREPLEFPTLEFGAPLSAAISEFRAGGMESSDITDLLKKITEFDATSIIARDYKSYPVISAPMAV